MLKAHSRPNAREIIQQILNSAFILSTTTVYERTIMNNPLNQRLEALRDYREMVNCCVSEQVCSGGNLLDVVLYSIPEHHPLDDLSEAGDSVQSAPMAFGTFHQHEHHRQNAVP